MTARGPADSSSEGPAPTPLLEVRGLTKRFGPLVALDAVDLPVAPGEIHAVLGENGAGKTTLMNLLYGLLRPDSGRLLWRGEAVTLGGPLDARRLGIGMVHQHFMLVPALTVWENVWLSHPERGGLALRPERARDEIRDLARRFGLDLDPDARVGELPVGARQRVEIAKALARRVSLLILDEPTAVLAPGEIRELFRVLRDLTSEGTSVLFISHKLDEVLEISDRITVLRRGRVAARCATAEADAADLTRRIVGDGVTAAGEPRSAPDTVEDAAPPVATGPLLVARGLETAPGDGVALRAIDLSLRGGEILGVTGVDGNGQDELVGALAGLVRPTAGRIELGGEDVTDTGVAARWRKGLSVLPGDRAVEGLVLDLSLWENLALRDFGAAWARGRGGGVRPGAHRERARSLLARHAVRASGPEALASSLSGGNQQKLLLARELSADPRVLVLLNPARGLDVGAAEALWRVLAELRDAGRAILLVSTDLDDVIERADRWAVLHRGRLTESKRPDRESIGVLMLGAESS